MTALSITQLAKRSKREAAARTRAAIKESTIARLAALPASETPIDQRIQRMLQASRPGCQDPTEATLPAPMHPAEAVGADLVAQAGGDFSGRVGRAVELVKLGQVQFPQYGTRFIPSGATGFYECNCPDSKRRQLRSFFGAVCKHSIAMLLASYLRQQAEAVTHQRMIDKAERRRR